MTEPKKRKTGGHRKNRRGRGARTQDPQQPDVWRRVAEELGGEYRAAGTRHQDAILVQRGPWRLVLDKYVVSTQYGTQLFTRAHTLYLATDDFRMVLARRHWYSRFAPRIVPPDVPIGDSEIEAKYVIRSRHPARLRSVFHDRDLREAIRHAPPIHVEVKGLGWWKRRKLGSRVRTIVARSGGVVMEPARLIASLDLVGSLAEQLVRIGSAVSDPVREGEHNGEVRRRL